MLDASGLEYRCLFLSDNGDTTPESAPWLVRLDATANFTRNVFTAGPAPWHLWTSQPGLILLSKLNLQGLWRHLRRFSRVTEPSGRQHFFRHWNHHVFLAWMTESRNHPDRSHAYFGTPAKPAVDAVLARGAPDDMVLYLSPDIETMAQTEPRPFRISGPEDPILRRGMVRPLATTLVRQLRIEHPAIVAQYQPLALEFAIEDTLMRLHSYGFRRNDILTELVVQDLYLGYPFENEDTVGHMLAVCHSDAPQEARYAELRAMIAALAGQDNEGRVHR